MTAAIQEHINANMNEFPFQLSINCISPEKQTISLSCTALLRSIKGRREVYDAIWNKKNVIAKVFTHKLSGKRHAIREWKGLNALSDRKINVPAPFFLGKTETGDWVVVTEKIIDSATVLEIFNYAHNPEKKLELLLLVCRELAIQHKAGVLQKDFHLENFLQANGKVYTLDPGQMQFFSQEVSKYKSISNLAMLMLYLQDNDKDSRIILCNEYYKLRNWEYTNQEELLIQKQIELQGKKGIERGLKKCLRTSKRFFRIKKDGITSVFDKTFCDETEALDFINQIDELMPEGKILKNGNTCFVSNLIWNKKNIVIKRYNHKSLIHSLCHSVMNSRARKAWLYAQRLIMLGISTPKSLAYIERRRGFILWNSYIVTEYVEGRILYDVLNDKSISESHRESIQKQVETLLDKTWGLHITHGDLKHSNILITQNGPVLTDLDSMRVHKLNLFYKLRQAKDVERFNR
ncbi:MAG: hypothetical protein JXA96_01440 [Sedimentisphaerales bacterium]|nr:hypothetical protein [Sedimentisphaerales bacterium]